MLRLKLENVTRKTTSQNIVSGHGAAVVADIVSGVRVMRPVKARPMPGPRPRRCGTQRAAGSQHREWRTVVVAPVRTPPGSRDRLRERARTRARLRVQGRVPVPRLLSSALLVASALASGCADHRLAAATLDPSSPGALAAAAEDYRAACAPCHGVDARGTGPVAASLRQPATDLTRLAARNGGTFPYDDTVAVIAGERAVDAHGTREMPIWSLRFGAASGATAVASIDARRRVALLARYLATLQRPAP